MNPKENHVFDALARLPGANLGGGCRGYAPLPEMTYGFLIQLCISYTTLYSAKKCGLIVLVTPFLSGAPLLKKILDPPLHLQKLSITIDDANFGQK